MRKPIFKFCFIRPLSDEEINKAPDEIKELYQFANSEKSYNFDRIEELKKIYPEYFFNPLN